MTRRAMPEKRQPTLEPLDEDVALFDGDRTGAGARGRVRRDVESGIASGEVRGYPTLFIDGVVHLGAYDAATLLEALAR